ncbi:hypothetical protein N657DRAFT_578054 [Parathielavia appendiculata]|uniref:CCHC-type domain-containing protein n=1 Tax=Parathielavia appendiculata TaxID=2587402 RepID=A0AAN6TV83_9PEZI|nr:hypothetical protein N657DRAFT_578054 [Parathielavia appendiculata]
MSWDNTNSGWGGGSATTADDAWGAAADSGWDNNAASGDNDNGDGACRLCNEEGHLARDCPSAPPKKCKGCESTDHLVKDCPNRVCKNCGEAGHTVSACDGARKIDRSHLQDMKTEDAWALINRAVNERDIDDVKEAIQTYVKSAPNTTYAELERTFRDQSVPLWLIAIEKPLADTFTNMDLQGNLKKKYTVTYRFQWNPPRPRDRELWPNNVDENIERLKDAGEVVYGGLPKCRNCDQVGHIAKSCPEEKVEKVNTGVIICFACQKEGHRRRDCPEPRVDKFACKNCGQSGHKAADCTEPRSAEGVECRKCNETGHFAKDCHSGGGDLACFNCGQPGHSKTQCTEPRNLANVQCRNCDMYGHTGRDCLQPRNWSRVKCSNCQQMGHTKVRCKVPLAPEDDGDAGHGGGGADNGGSGDGGFETGAGNGNNDGWNTAATGGVNW